MNERIVEPVRRVHTEPTRETAALVVDVVDGNRIRLGIERRSSFESTEPILASAVAFDPDQARTIVAAIRTAVHQIEADELEGVEA